MVAKCANSSCSALHTHDEGRFFRFDLDIGNSLGKTQRKTAYLWLCPACARWLIPKVSVHGDTVRLALTTQHAACSSRSVQRIN